MLGLDADDRDYLPEAFPLLFPLDDMISTSADRAVSLRVYTVMSKCDISMSRGGTEGYQMIKIPACWSYALGPRRCSVNGMVEYMILYQRNCLQLFG